MLIVGVDFGTTNVRVATWDKDALNTVPEPRTVASGDSKIMPSVIAFRRNLNGDVDLIVGEEADGLTNSPDIQVIPNIKRWAMSSDSYMRWHMDARSVGWPSWWDTERRLVNFWGKEFPVRGIIRDILKQAISTAGITGSFEWRAGCPVHAGLDYRSDLTAALSELAGQGKINWVVEEPLLLLTLGYHALSNPVGSYLIYDLGGGSFDSAMAEIYPKDESDERGEFIVYGADGHPLVGGADIDEILSTSLEGQGYLANSPTSIRTAKESLSPTTPVQNLIGGINLTWDDVEVAVSQCGLLRKTPMATRDAYVSAKRMWNRPDIDEVLHQYSDTGEVRFVWQLTYQEMSKEIDTIVLYGGATKLGDDWFIKKLKNERVFGHKAQTASEWLKDVDIPDAELLGISLGACYFADKDYFDSKGFTSFVNRLPVRITLQNLQTGKGVGYKPFDHLTDPSKPFSEFVSEALQQEQDNPQKYELSIATPDGVIIEQIPIDGYLEPENRHTATDLRLRVDRYGQVFVDKRSSGPGLSWTKQFPVVTRPPWQTELQRGSIGEGILTLVRNPEYHQRSSQGSGENWRQDTKP